MAGRMGFGVTLLCPHCFLRTPIATAVAGQAAEGLAAGGKKTERRDVACATSLFSIYLPSPLCYYHIALLWNCYL